MSLLPASLTGVLLMDSTSELLPGKKRLLRCENPPLFSTSKVCFLLVTTYFVRLMVSNCWTWTWKSSAMRNRRLYCHSHNDAFFQDDAFLCMYLKRPIHDLCLQTIIQPGGSWVSRGFPGELRVCGKLQPGQEGAQLHSGAWLPSPPRLEEDGSRGGRDHSGNWNPQSFSWPVYCRNPHYLYWLWYVFPYWF